MPGDGGVRQRRRWIELYRRTGDAGLVCRRCGISRPTLRKWWRRFLTLGEVGLAEQSRRPTSSPARVTDDRVQLFCHVLRKHIGAFAAVLGGIDTLVFTGGIGEHAAPVREETCRGLEHLGIRIDRERNDRNEAIVSAPRSACTVRTLRTDEDLVIARHTRMVVATQLAKEAR